MNETEFLRRQLAAERAHLREILGALREGSQALRPTAAVERYLEWAGARLVTQLRAQLAALQAAGAGGPALESDQLGKLDRLSKAAPRASETRLLESLAIWGDALDGMAGTTLRIGQWRTTAQLTADTILEERQLYAAARAAAGRP